MRFPVQLLRLVAVVLIGGCSSVYPDIPDAFERLRAPWWKEAQDILVAPDGSAVILDMSGPAPCKLVYDDDLDETEYMAGTIASIAFGRSGSDVLSVDVLDALILRPPDMDTVRRVGSSGELSYISLVVADPRADRWIVVDQGWPDMVSVVDAASGRVTQHWEHGLDYPQAAVVDAASGLVVLVSESEIHVLDPDVPGFIGGIPSPGVELAYDIAAANGRVWIATYDDSGDVLEFDVETRTITRRFGTGAIGRVHLATDPARTHLIVMTSEWKRDEPDPTRIAVHEIDGHELTEIALIETRLEGSPQGVALLPERGLAFIAAGRAGGLVWRYRTAE